MNLDPHEMFAPATSATTTMLAKSSSATTRRQKRRRGSTATPKLSNSNDTCASVRSSTEYNYASERLHGSCEMFRADGLTSTVPATMSHIEETNMPFIKTTLEKETRDHREHKTRLNTTTSSNTYHTANHSTRLFSLLNYDHKRHHSMLVAIFIVIVQLTVVTLAQQASTVLLSQEMSNKTTPRVTMASTTIVATSTTALPAMAGQSIMAASSENNNMGDIKRQQMSTSEQQSAIEQVAKAEALTAASPANQQHQQHHHHHHQQQPVAAALQQQSNVNLFEVCKVQTVINQHLTNLSQIVFQPSDICSNWHKMSRSDPPPPQATPATIMANSEINPWYYIEQLNLSENNLTVLHDSSGLSRLINLFELKITHNQLSRCEEASLFGLHKLQILDLSHNKLMALPAKFFQPVKQTIKKLNLSFNSISVLVPTLFDSLNQLEYLDLSHNDITSHWINDRLFKNLTQLHYLDLSFNKLTVFSSPMTFSSLQQLETLSLQHNELRQVPETIQHLRYLSSLDLSQNFIHDITNASYLSNCRLLFNLNLESNILENITRDAFSDMPALKVLNLANNRIHHLDQQAFEYVPDLHALRLDSNRLVDFGQAFVNLRFLLMLNISSNRIASFDYAQIPLGLQWLDLHSNKIDKLNNFFYSPSAQQMSASNDILSSQQASIGQQWQSMLRLTTLDASYNLIRELDNTSLPESLETVQLNNNHIKTIASQTFSTKSNLTRINLSNNQLTTLPFDGLKLNNNRDSSLPLQQQKFVDVYLSNNPFVCNCNMGWFSQLLLASSNPFQGGAIPTGTASRDHTFVSIYTQMLARQLPRVADAALVNCHLPFGRQTTYTADPHQWSPVSAANQLALQQNHHALAVHDQQPLILRQSELLQSVHLCPYKSHCFALCYCCDFDACDCEMSCPENCSCYYDQTWSTNIVDCSANNQINGNSQARFTQMMMGASGGGQSNHHYNTHHHHHRQPSSALVGQQQQQGPQMVRFKTIPEKIPMDVTDLFLDGLELVQLQSNALIGRKNLKSLYLNNSRLYSIEPKALATQKALRVLQLNSNHLSTLHGYEFEQQAELRELYLANNDLTSIANATFMPLRSLQVLHLQNNRLYHFNFWSNMPTGHKLISINLGANPWSCQCDHIEPMLQWLQANIKYIHDRKAVSCQYDQTTALHLVSPLATENSLSASIYGSNDENYPMFDKKICLNYTVYPVVNGNGQLSTPSGQYGHQQPADSEILMTGPDSTLMPPFRAIESQPDDQPLNPNFQQPPNDEPPRVPGEFNNNPMPVPNDRSPLYRNTPSHNDGGIQYPPGFPSRASIMTPSLLIGAGLMLIILIVVVLSLVHYRRSMGMWFYSNYGLNMFSASKSHKHSVNSLGKHHHHPHLSHQYGVGSSAGSTSSSSAASSNLSQALCQQQQHQSASGSTGLVTTPLIVTNNNQAMSMNATATPYQDDDRLFDAYLTYSKFDEQFVNDYIAPELECSPPSYRVALHYRDLPVTTSEFLNDCIIETANASRRVIMVVSEQFLRTEWMQYEFRSAHLEALKSNYRQRLIIIMLGQPSGLTAADLDPDMLQWLKSCTCVHWGEKMFWQRLRFALPDLHFARGTPNSAAQPNAYLRYQTLAPHQQQQQLQALQQQQQQHHHHLGQQQPPAGAKPKRNNLGANLLRSATGLLSGNHNTPLPPPSHQQLITSNVHPHPSLGRPLPQPGGGMAHFNQMKQPQPQQQLHLAEEHHYAHLTPATMIQQQGAAPGDHAYHQPIYGDPNQRAQVQQQQQQRDNPVHI